MMRHTPVALLLPVIVAATVPPTHAQTPTKVYRIALLATNPLPSGESFPRPAVAELARHGFVEGRNLKLESHFGSPERLSDVARELVATHPDVILAGGLPAAKAAAAATRAIPIIAIGSYFLEAGLVTSLARPGDNLTGVNVPELDIRRLELLRELTPKVRRVALLYDPLSSSVEHVDAVKTAAQNLGFIVQLVEAGRPEEIGGALRRTRADGAEAVNVLSSPLFFEKEDILAAAAIEVGLPTVWEFLRRCVANYSETEKIFSRAGAQLARVVEGAPVGELPVEQPMKFKLVINLKMAEAIRLAVPESLLARADEVIE